MYRSRDSRTLRPPRAARYRSLALGYALLAAGLLLWPFEFSWPFRVVPNAVAWLPGTGGVEFRGPGLIRSAGSARPLHDAMVAGAGWTLEIWATSSSIDQSGPARIVSYSLDTQLRNFTLGQDQDSLVLRLRTTHTNLDGKPQLRVANVFHGPEPRHLVVSYDYSSERVYANGRLVAQASHRTGGFANWDPAYPLLLGNEGTGTRPWRGRLFLVALYGRALSSEEVGGNHRAGIPSASPGPPGTRRATEGLVALYLFDEGNGQWIAERSGRARPLDLEIPPVVKVMSLAEREFLSTRDQGGGLDRAVNVVLLIPLGFLMDRIGGGRRRPTRAAALALLVGAGFALGMESVQYLLVARSSSLVDLVLNLTGVGMGVGLSRLLERPDAIPAPSRPPGPR